MKKSELNFEKKQWMKKQRLWDEHHRLNMKTSRYYSVKLKRLIQ